MSGAKQTTGKYQARGPRGWFARNESAHPVIKDALARGHLESGEAYHIPPIPGHDRTWRGAQLVRQAAHHLGFSIAVWIADPDGDQCNPRKGPCKDADAPHTVHFRIFAKNKGREHTARETGGDPSKLKYNPFKRAERPIVDDNGRKI